MMLRNIFAVLFPLLACGAASTEEDTNTGATFPLPSVVVVGKRVNAPPSMVVREASEGDFTVWNVRTAAGALARTPGVNVQIGGSSGDASAWIRGFRDRDILVLFDGIPIGSALEGTLDLNEISLNSIATTRVMKAAPSVIYGANGLGGVIDFIPRPADAFDVKTAELELAEDGGQAYRGSIGSSSGGLRYFATAGYEEASEYSLPDDFAPQLNQPAGRRINSDFRRATATLLLDSEKSPIGQTSFFLNISDVERGLTPRSTSDDPDFERLTLSRRTTLGLSNRFDSVPVSLKAYYNKYDSELSVYTDATYTTVDEIDYGDDYTLGAIAYGHLPTWQTSTLVLSGSWSSDVFEAAGVFEGFDRAELNTLVLSAEHETVLDDRLSVAFGAIYTHVDQPAVDRGISAISPQVSLGYQVGDRVSLHASAAQRTRFPKLREFYRRRWGNPDLVEQTAENYEVGSIFAHNGNVATDISVFHSRIDGLIDRPTRRSVYQNLQVVDVNGLEVASGGWWTDRVFVRVSYAYVDVAESLPDGRERQLRSRPRHSAFADVRFRWSENLLIGLNAQYVADLYDLDDEEIHTRVPSFFLVDAKLSRDFSNGVNGYLAVSNVTDENYVFRIGDPRAGRTFRAGITFRR